MTEVRPGSHLGPQGTALEEQRARPSSHLVPQGTALQGLRVHPAPTWSPGTWKWPKKASALKKHFSKKQTKKS